MGKLSRRLRRGLQLSVIAALAAGCGSDDDSREDSAAPPTPAEIRTAPVRPSGGTQESDDTIRPAAGDMLPYADVDGKLARGYSAYPNDMIEPLPGVLLIHDWSGLNDEMRAIADQIASRGFIVLAVDLFAGKVATERNDARGVLRVLVEQPELARDNLRQAYEFLDGSFDVPRTAVIGWGAGGLWALNAALMFPEDLDAIAMVQGQFFLDPARLQPLRMPVLGLYGAADRDIPNDRALAFGDALTAAGVKNKIRLFPTAGRGFMLKGGSSFDERQSKNAWEEIFAFLDDNLALATP